MERNSRTSQGFKLESQIREAYGKVTYTETCHYKIIDRLKKRIELIKKSQIALSALTSGGFLTTIFCEEIVVNIIGSIISIILFIINTYTKSFNLAEDVQEHKLAADGLWKIREEYVTLLTDFEVLELEQIMKKRDELQDRTYEIYSTYPGTDAKSYAEAQQALKTDEEQTFSEHEIDVMLPISLRRNNRNIKD